MQSSQTKYFFKIMIHPAQQCFQIPEFKINNDYLA